MWLLLLSFIFFNSVFADDREKTRTVIIEDGAIVGTKFWDGDFYEFSGIPYAEAPTGRDRYQAPLPVKPWTGVLSADVRNIICHQSYYTDDEDKDEEFVVSGEDDCLVINLYVPEIATEDNPVPVVVYIHSGAYAGGNGNMARFHYLARHDIVVINFNYRLGALGFACLGNKEIPGNAGLKDQLAALKWIKKNVKKFGGDPNKITLAGYSVGASMAEILSLSKTTNGLIDQLILDSASALSPFAINRDPIGTAKNLALAMGYNGTDSLEGLTEFYLNASADLLAAKSLNFFLPNSTFGFAPCIENVYKGIQPIIKESPMDTLKKGKFNKIPVLIGFSHMEGISRTIKFGEWREEMTKDFSKFIPADLTFDNDETKQTLSVKLKKKYFQGDEVNYEKLQNYIDYFSDAMFKYAIMKSMKLRATSSQRKIYLYEFNYVGKLNMQHNYMDKIKGASHRDQTAYILDFFGWTNSYKDLEMRDRMTVMWADFVKYGDPTAYESAVVNYKWLPYTNDNQNYLQIVKKPTMKKNLFVDGFNYWNRIYEKYYWNPTAPEQPKVQKRKTNQPKPDENDDSKNVNEKKESKVVAENNTQDNKVNQEKKAVDEIKKEEETIKQSTETLTVEDVKKESIKDQKVVESIQPVINQSEQELVKEKKSEQKNNKDKISENENKTEDNRVNQNNKNLKEDNNKEKQQTVDELQKEAKNVDQGTSQQKKSNAKKEKENQDAIKIVKEIKKQQKVSKDNTQKTQEKKK